MRPRDHDRHKLGSAGWLRAAVLGASDGIVSTSSLLLGLAAAQASHATLLLSGTAALVAGAMSMAAGEYVSVYSQADSEAAALAQERAELRDDFAGEREQKSRALDHDQRIDVLLRHVLNPKETREGQVERE